MNNTTTVTAETLAALIGFNLDAGAAYDLAKEAGAKAAFESYTQKDLKGEVEVRADLLINHSLACYWLIDAKGAIKCYIAPDDETEPEPLDLSPLEVMAQIVTP